MKLNNKDKLRAELLQLPPDKLDELLMTELRKPDMDDDLVRLMMEVIRQQEGAAPEKPARKRNWLVSIVAAAAVLCLIVLAVPPALGSSNVFQLIGSWTEDLFAFTDPDDPVTEYVFETDHPGLQQIYDAVTELGITKPIVPMWVPDGYELVDFKTSNTPAKVKLYATLMNDDNRITLTIDIYGTELSRKFETNDTVAMELEIGEVTHHITNNDRTLLAVWNVDNIECSLSVDEAENVLYMILDSIYRTGVTG